MPIPIFLLPLLFAYILTRKVRVSITKKEKWRVEINFTLLGIHFNRLLNKKERKEQKSNDNKRAKSKRIYGRIMRGLRHAELEIRCFNFPIFDCVQCSRDVFPSHIKYHAILSAFLAFLDSKAKKLTVFDNAITLCPDDNSCFLDASITARLFHILSTLALIWIDEKRRKRELKCQRIR